MKKIVCIFLALFLVFALIACNSDQNTQPTKEGNITGDESAPTGDPTTKAEKKRILVGVSYAMMDENKQLGHDLFMESVERFNAEDPGYYVEVLMTNADGSADKQISDIETLMASDCNVIRVDALDVNGAVSICEAVHDAGIPILEVHGVQSDKIDVMGTGFDHISTGMMYADVLERMLLEDSSLQLKMGYFQGNPNMSNTLNRISGAEYLAETYPDQVEILDVQYANFKTDEAMAIMEDWLTAYPEMNTICASSDAMSLGAVNVLKSAGRLDEFIITGIDGTEQALDAVDNGEMLCTVMLNQVYVQDTWLDVCVRLAQGETLEHRMNLGASALFPVTKDNIAEARELAKKIHR